MRNINWEMMRPQDIEIRPAVTKDGKTTLLLYQDSRNTMDALDRNFGEFGWSISYKDVGGQIYGCLSIKDPDTGDWISKEDTGDESNISEKKGQSSDILKRCAVRFGYGRELYSAPRIVVPDDGYNCSGYKVTEIAYDDNREITHIVISNRFGKETYRWDVDAPKTAPKAAEKPNAETKSDSSAPAITVLKGYCSAMKAAEGTDLNELLKFFEYYKKIIETKGWNGDFKADLLYNRWLSKKMN